MTDRFAERMRDKKVRSDTRIVAGLAAIHSEKRRAYCPRDPKPFCAHCDTHCYKPDESEWQRQMMTYAGPRSMWHGYAIPGIKHALEARKWKREMARRADREARSAGNTNDAAR
ncbi:MAG: Uncharacterized protein XD74_1646 [Actinobacteria bacterium 66_15]|nr:MAG: Uncharacterized protein XD74_1646 [Actinobacteria bacterium 66_15]